MPKESYVKPEVKSQVLEKGALGNNLSGGNDNTDPDGPYT